MYTVDTSLRELDMLGVNAPLNMHVCQRGGCKTWKIGITLEAKYCSSPASCQGPTAVCRSIVNAPRHTSKLCVRDIVVWIFPVDPAPSVYSHRVAIHYSSASVVVPPQTDALSMQPQSPDEW